MSKSKSEREEAKRLRRREKRKERQDRAAEIKDEAQYGVRLIGGREPLVFPSLENRKTLGVLVTPVATSSEMTLMGGPEALLPRIQSLLSAPVLFVVGASRERPGRWQLLVGGVKSGPLQMAVEGVRNEDGTFGPEESYSYLVEILDGVAKQFGHKPERFATNLIEEVFESAEKKWWSPEDETTEKPPA